MQAQAWWIPAQPKLLYVPPANHAAGELADDTTWSDAVIVDETVVVPDGVVLTIEHGTVVLLAQGRQHHGLWAASGKRHRS